MWVFLVVHYYCVAVLVEGAVVNFTLTVAPVRFVGGSNNPINFTTRAYNNQIPGPTITVKQGDTLKITLVNAIAGEADVEPTPNTFGFSNTTNLHLHGT